MECAWNSAKEKDQTALIIFFEYAIRNNETGDSYQVLAPDFIMYLLWIV